MRLARAGAPESGAGLNSWQIAFRPAMTFLASHRRMNQIPAPTTIDPGITLRPLRNRSHDPSSTWAASHAGALVRTSQVSLNRRRNSPGCARSGMVLAGNRLSDYAGRIRTEQNWIGGSGFNPCSAAFVPPPPEEVPDLLAYLCQFCSDEVLPALAQAAIAHAQFETIHPFVDGNGRTGRALTHVIPRRRGLAPRLLPPISLVLATWSSSYIDGLVGTRYRDRTPRPPGRGSTDGSQCSPPRRDGRSMTPLPLRSGLRTFGAHGCRHRPRAGGVGC